MESKLGSNFDPNDENYIENNLLKMDIFYKEFNFENIVEIPAYPVSVLSKYMFFLSRRRIRVSADEDGSARCAACRMRIVL